MGGREPVETRVLISLANERMLKKLVSSRGKMVDGFLALRSTWRRNWVLELLVSRTVKTPVYVSE